MSAEPAHLFGAPGDRCQNCSAPLAVDQRYCVHCGTRRGKSRFSLAEVAAQAAPPPPPPSEQKRTARSRMPAGVTLVTGVATLLLAMGVGVLIGHDSTSAPVQKTPAPIVVNGSSATPTTSTTASNQAVRQVHRGELDLQQEAGLSGPKADRRQADHRQGDRSEQGAGAAGGHEGVRPQQQARQEPNGSARPVLLRRRGLSKRQIHGELLPLINGVSHQTLREGSPGTVSPPARRHEQRQRQPTGAAAV